MLSHTTSELSRESRIARLTREIAEYQDLFCRPRLQATTTSTSRPNRLRLSRPGELDSISGQLSNTSHGQERSRETVPSRTSRRPSGSFAGIARSVMAQSDAPVAWNLPSWQPSRSARIDSAAAIRGLQWDGSFIDECQHYPVMLHDEIIDAEWTDVGAEMRVARWNTVWTDIGEAHTKKVHCIEG